MADGKKMDVGKLKSMLAASRQDALAGMQADKLSTQRADALRYYMGDMNKDMPAGAGRSKAVSTDVADTVDGMMPSLMDVFCGGDEVVTFNPIGPQDEDAAQQETDYVNHVFMQRNPGFLILFSFIKDALLSKVGIVKAWWETKTEIERETYYGLDDVTYGLLLTDPTIEVVAHTDYPAPPPGQLLADAQ